MNQRSGHRQVFVPTKTSVRIGQSRSAIRRMRVIDSHTGGEPTRVVIDGGPDLGTGPLAERREQLPVAAPSLFSEVINEPRGSGISVGALLVEPHEAGCAAGVIFFNNVNTLGMCGHGTFGLAVTLAHLGRITPGVHRLDTPVGVVEFEWHDDALVSVKNVPSFLHQEKVSVDVEGHGLMEGDVAWGGNWFFIVAAPPELPLFVRNEFLLTELCWRIRHALVRQGITGADGSEIDHVELIGPPADPKNSARNFVHCPGGAYDRSPCGTGISAKLACLAATGRLQPGETWTQEGITGSVFKACYKIENGQIVPTITGNAYITAEATLLFDPADHWRSGSE